MGFAWLFRHPLGDGTITPQFDGDGYYVAQGFGEFNSDIAGGTYHLGVDWNGEIGGDDDMGEPVFAVADGTVVQTGYRADFGNFIVLRHDLETPQTINGQSVTTVYSLYAHLQTVGAFSLNQLVTIGQQVGTLGNTGDSGPAHLHFEMTVNNVLPTDQNGYENSVPAGWIDPVAFIEANLNEPVGPAGPTQAELIRAGTFLAVASYGGTFFPSGYQGSYTGESDSLNYDDNYRGFLADQGWQILTNQGGSEGQLNLALAGLTDQGEFTAGGLFRSTEGLRDNDQGEGSEANRGEALVAKATIGGEQVLVLAFRGSDGFDAFYEEQTFTADGAAEYYTWIRPVIVAAAAYAQNNGISTVIVSGHSLGGTMADLFALADSDLFAGIDLHVVSLASAGIDPLLAGYEQELGLDLSNSGIGSLFVSGIGATLPVITQLGLPSGISSYTSIAHSQDRVYDPAQPDGSGLNPNSVLEENLHFSGADHISLALPNIANADVDYGGFLFPHGFGAEHNSHLYWVNVNAMTKDPLYGLYNGTQSIFIGIQNYRDVPDYSGLNTTTLFQEYTGSSTYGVDNDEGLRALLGTNLDDYILGLSGNDSLIGYDGNDLLSGGAGSDRLQGRVGNDTLHGGSGQDILLGDQNNDQLDGGANSDNLTGGSGSDTFAFGAEALVGSGYYADIIHDFNRGNSGTFDSNEDDVLDLRALITPDGRLQAVADLVRFVVRVDGSGLDVLVDPDGAGARPETMVAFLKGVSSGEGITVLTGAGGASPGVLAAVSAPGSYTISPSSRTADEDTGTISFTITRPSTVNAETVYVSTTINRGSLNDGDYAGWLNVPVTFAAGDATETVSIAINDDNDNETAEQFGLIIQSSPSQPASQFLASASFTIIDDDLAGASSTFTEGSDQVWIDGATTTNTSLDGLGGNDTAIIDVRSAGTMNTAYNTATGAYSVVTTGGILWLYNVENFVVIAGSGDDSLYGGPGTDLLFGGSGDDQIIGGSGIDVLDGGGGNDRIVEVGYGDIVEGGNGIDLVYFDVSTSSEDITINLATGQGAGGTWTGIEFVSGTLGSGNDAVIAGMQLDSLNGGAGDNTLTADYSGTTPEDETLTSVTFSYSSYFGTLNGYAYRAGGDPYSFSLNGMDNLRLTGTAGDDHFGLSGTGGNHAINGGAGNDTLYGGSGTDTLLGGDGDDYFYNVGPGDVVDGGAGIDRLYFDLTGMDTDLTLNLLTGESAGSSWTGIEFASGTLGSGNDAVIAGMQLDSLNGGAGDNTLTADYSGTTPEDETLTSVTFSYSSYFGTLNGYAYRAGGDPYSFSLNGMDNLRLTGTAGDDHFGLSGTGGNHAINGGAGNDTLYGGSGTDTLLGGDGDDDLSSSSGNDALYGGGGNDTLRGEAGDDTVQGGDGDDTVHASAGEDFVHGGTSQFVAPGFLVTDTGYDTLVFSGTRAQYLIEYVVSSGIVSYVITDLRAGSPEGIERASGFEVLRFADGDLVQPFLPALTLVGTAGNDSITGGPGNDTILGLDGNDTLDGSVSADSIDGGSGDDSIAGGAGNDVLLGGLGNDVLTGGEGIDTLFGGAGNDVLYGGSASPFFGNVMYGEAGNDLYYTDSPFDALAEPLVNAGRDTVVASYDYTLNTHFEELWLTGETGLRGTGNGLANRILGTSGNDTLDGEAGSDTLAGGAGDDLYLVDNTRDIIQESADGGLDTVHISASANYRLSVHVENAVLLGTAPRATGNSSNNVITGNLAANLIDGGGGDDTLTGGDGADSLYGSTGNDVLLGGGGNDRFYIATGSGVDSIDGGDGFDVIQAAADNASLRLSGLSGIERINGNGFVNFVILGSSAADVMDFSAIQLLQVALIDAGAGNDTLIGSAGADTLYGNNGNDSLSGGGGVDRLAGGLGSDTLEGGAGGDRFVYLVALESRTGSLADRIGDFTPGSDKIDLSALDPDTATPDDQPFAFIGTAAFAASGIGQVRAIASGADRLVQVDVDGNGLADMEIRLTGAPVLSAVDFVL